MDFDEVYAEYLNALEAIAEQHDELTGSDVRARLRQVINYYFVWGHAVGADFPQRYGMSSQDGDQAVARATKIFIEQAQQVITDCAIGDDRNYLLENFDIETPNGAFFDEFIGSTDAPLDDALPTSDTTFRRYWAK